MASSRPTSSANGLVSALRHFMESASAGGIVLMIAALLAMLIANSPFAQNYFDTLHSYVGGLSILHWINDGLMAIFFLFVGLEIKRELVDGRLSTWDQRRLPVLAAIAGMAAPALVYLAVIGAILPWQMVGPFRLLPISPSRSACLRFSAREPQPRSSCFW